MACTSPSGSKPCFETPTLVTPLLLPEHDGQDRFAEEHMSMDMVESWNDRRVQDSLPMRPLSARPSVSELEAEFEAQEPLYYMPLKPGMAAGTAGFPGNYGCNSGGSSSSRCLLAYEMETFSSPPRNGIWLGGDAMALMPEIATVGIAADTGFATASRPRGRSGPDLPSKLEGSADLTSSLAAADPKSGNNLASSPKPMVLTTVEEEGKTADIYRAGGTRSNSQDSSTGEDHDVHHAMKAVIHDGHHGPATASRGISCRRMLPGRSMITIGPPALFAPDLEGGSLADALRLDDPYNSSQRSGSAHSCQERISDLCPVFVDVDNYGGATFIEPTSSGQRPGSHSRKVPLKRPLSADDATLTAIRSGRRAGEYTHINQDMLKDGGYFDMPIQEAAQQLGIGLSVLKRVCRTIGLARWPFRKRQSLRNVMEQTKLYLNDIDFASKDKVMRLLDQAAASLDGSTGEDLGPAFKRYRQAVFKLNYKINKLKDNKKGGNGVKVAIPKSAAASLEALASFALDGCEETFDSGDYHDMASTAVKNPFGGGDVKGSVAVKAFGAGVESLSNSIAAQRLSGQPPSRHASAKARDRTVAVAMPSHAVAIPFRPRERTTRRAAFVNAAAVSKAAAAADAASDSSTDSGDTDDELDVDD